MTIHYEWDVEEVDPHGDIQDHFHSGSFAQAKVVNDSPAIEEGYTSRIVLIRDDDNARTGCRAWAYLKDGRLPEYFEDASGVEIARVPKRFHDEVSKNL